MKKIKLNSWNLSLTVRRIIGIFLILSVSYLVFIFSIKLIFLILYKLVTTIDTLFAGLV